MTDTATASTTRREPRYSVTSPDSTSVTVVVSDSDESNCPLYHGTVHDLSAKGMRLNLSVQISPMAKIQIRLCVPEFGIDMLTSGVVRWQQTRDKQSWWIGCSLDEPLSSQFLLDMATYRIIDRRQDFRTKCEIGARAKLELNADPIDVTITNYSFGGCCITSPEAFEVHGDRLLLALSTTRSLNKPVVRIPVRVRWSRELANGFSVGCAFVSHDGYVALRDFISDDGDALSRKRYYEVSRIQFNGTWIAIALMVLISLKIIELWTTQTNLFNNFRAGWQLIHQPSQKQSNDLQTTIPVKKQENEKKPPH